MHVRVIHFIFFPCMGISPNGIQYCSRVFLRLFLRKNVLDSQKKKNAVLVVLIIIIIFVVVVVVLLRRCGVSVVSYLCFHISID